ncbi:MAG: ADP-ribosylglycohydrolase family protein [Chloroflexi bacterium]|nr:ADP-ribosylglycohydrolase family protein [Chloroflexota bacterium]
MIKSAWLLERNLRDTAVPFDRRVHPSEWYDAGFEVPHGDALINLFWFAHVPGSGAPEIPYQEMIQAKGNQGYDVSEAEALLEEGIALHKAGDKDGLRVLTARLQAALYEAPLIPEHPYHQFRYPDSWEAVVAAMQTARISNHQPTWQADYEARIYQGWVGQLAGGAFGTAIEGYTGKQIAAVYGEIDGYVTTPETTNDDVVYELILLDVFERMGRGLTSRELGLEWVRQIPFGWSAEWVALRNLNLGIMPPQSGAWHNPYSDWIGAQMRTMICGLLAPGNPLEAARLAYTDSVVSHARNGVCGGIFAAVLTALAFVCDDPRAALLDGLAYLPQESEYVTVIREILDRVSTESDAYAALEFSQTRFAAYNWIHAYPNIAADIIALWYGEGDFTHSMSLLAKAGNDVDCNAGLVGTILGIMHGVPKKWANPLNDRLETYIKGKEVLSIRELAAHTTRLAKSTWA